jgi:hypothetical protein
MQPVESAQLGRRSGFGDKHVSGRLVQEIIEGGEPVGELGAQRAARRGWRSATADRSPHRLG